MSVERFRLSDSGSEARAATKTGAGASTKVPSVPTEAEVVRAMMEWEEGAAYRKMRHAANVGGCYSTATICLAHDTFGNQRLTDDLVRNRLSHAEFSKAELNPMEPGAPSVAEHVSLPMLKRLLMGMRGTFTPEEAGHFTDYHLEECDYDTLRLVADHTGFTQAERQEFFELTDWMANPEFAPGAVSAIVKATGAESKTARRRPSLVKGLAATAIAMAAIPAAIAFGAVAIVGAVGLVVIAIVAAGTSGVSDKSEDKHPDLRSDYNRCVWADDHNWEADGEIGHNYDADGDYPW